ncbi:MAG TPA: hypothetical protein VEJ36_08585 [Nitrososphaerales archaeon]|nr:hypothetical protein [Nitrososphaerales archaeon]
MVLRGGALFPSPSTLHVFFVSPEGEFVAAYPSGDRPRSLTRPTVYWNTTDFDVYTGMSQNEIGALENGTLAVSFELPLNATLGLWHVYVFLTSGWRYEYIPDPRFLYQAANAYYLGAADAQFTVG